MKKKNNTKEINMLTYTMIVKKYHNNNKFR